MVGDDLSITPSSASSVKPACTSAVSNGHNSSISLSSQPSISPATLASSCQTSSVTLSCASSCQTSPGITLTRQSQTSPHSQTDKETTITPPNLNNKCIQANYSPPLRNLFDGFIQTESQVYCHDNKTTLVRWNAATQTFPGFLIGYDGDLSSKNDHDTEYFSDNPDLVSGSEVHQKFPANSASENTSTGSFASACEDNSESTTVSDVCATSSEGSTLTLESHSGHSSDPYSHPDSCTDTQDFNILLPTELRDSVTLNYDTCMTVSQLDQIVVSSLMGCMLDVVDDMVEKTSIEPDIGSKSILVGNFKVNLNERGSEQRSHEEKPYMPRNGTEDRLMLTLSPKLSLRLSDSLCNSFLINKKQTPCSEDNNALTTMKLSSFQGSQELNYVTRHPFPEHAVLHNLSSIFLSPSKMWAEMLTVAKFSRFFPRLSMYSVGKQNIVKPEVPKRTGKSLRKENSESRLSCVDDLDKSFNNDKIALRPTSINRGIDTDLPQTSCCDIDYGSKSPRPYKTLGRDVKLMEPDLYRYPSSTPRLTRVRTVHHEVCSSPALSPAYKEKVSWKSPHIKLKNMLQKKSYHITHKSSSMPNKTCSGVRSTVTAVNDPPRLCEG